MVLDAFGSVMAGQIAGLIHKRESCKEIIADIMNETEKVISKVNK